MYKKKKSRLPLIITVFLIIVAAGAGMYIYQLNAKEASTDNSKEEEIVLEESQRLEYAKIVSISGNEMTVTADSDKEQTWLIPVGTDVVTKLGTTTTFSRLANGDNIRLLTQTDDEGNESNIIEIKNMNKGYMLGEDKVPVLRDINFTVKKGEFVAILGPSGSGKTTLMNIIGCMDILDSGEYYLNGRAIHETEEKELTEVRNREIGFR